jgi:pimeloyl-ACP methyl ester carboxylesterase
MSAEAEKREADGIPAAHGLRTYGARPYRVAVLHGGPGAPGEMAPVARELADATRGVLEPLQTAATLEGQVSELEAVLRTHATLPVILIGWSWGAWLGLILAARHPSLVRKLVLVGAPPFLEPYALGIMDRRIDRLGEDEAAEVGRLTEALSATGAAGQDAAFARLGALLARADILDPLTLDTEAMRAEYAVYRGVWPVAEELRRGGALLDLAAQVRCPVIAIHGDYDPHPAEGVREPLSRVVSDFRSVPLPACGHYPWLERGARERFFEVLTVELQ